VLWSLVHIYFLIGFRNRMAVFLDWAWAWLTYARGARLITGEGPRG
jgi:NADH dehydrogenase